MERRARISSVVGLGLLLGAGGVGNGAVVATPEPTALPTPVGIVDVWSPADTGDQELRALAGVYSGFAAAVDGGAGYPDFVVDSLADQGAGSVREALAAAVNVGGGRVVFAVAGDVVLARGLRVPANTTLDGLSAPPPGVTLWGEQTGAHGGGVLEIFDGNVIVRGLRIRNAGNDGVQIAPKNGYAIAGIVIDHCSVTNSADGGIDVTGHDGLTVSDVTLSWNYVAGNGGVCDKGLCGGGALIKYGVTRVSVHGNFWDKNLRRNPAVNGELIDGGSLVDVRGNVVRQYVESGIQVTSGARGNVISNSIDGPHPLSFYEAEVWAAANDTPDASAPVGTAPAPFEVPVPLGAVARALVIDRAGVPPRDRVDEFYVEAVPTYDELKLVDVGPGVVPTLASRVDALPSPAARHKCRRRGKDLVCAGERRGRPTDQRAPSRYRR